MRPAVSPTFPIVQEVDQDVVRNSGWTWGPPTALAAGDGNGSRNERIARPSDPASGAAIEAFAPPAGIGIKDLVALLS